MRVLFLDVDGVLEPDLARRLSEVLRVTRAEIVLASDWRRDRELLHLRDELRAAGIDGSLLGVTPILSGTQS